QQPLHDGPPPPPPPSSPPVASPAPPLPTGLATASPPPLAPPLPASGSKPDDESVPSCAFVALPPSWKKRSDPAPADAQAEPTAPVGSKTRVVSAPSWVRRIR